MPISYDIETRFYEDSTIDHSYDQLVDLRRADRTSRSPNVLRQLAAVSSRPKVAVVAPKDLSFGLDRMHEALLETLPWEFMVFRTIDAAFAWFGLPQDLIENYAKDAREAD